MKIHTNKLSGTVRSPLIAVITGASSGIGRATALQLAAGGAHVMLVARRKEKLDEVAEEISAFGGNARVIPADVSVFQQVEEAVRIVVEKEGHIDVLINNAGYGVYGSVEECGFSDYENQIKVNFLGAVYFTKVVLPIMHQANRGSIIVVSSIYGDTTLPFYSGYCASKFALNSYTDILRRELGGTGIDVSLVCPGPVETEFESSITQRRSRRNIRKLLPAVSAENVADEIIKCINNPKRKVIIPRVRKLQIVFQFLFPQVYEWYYRKRGAPI